METTYIYILKDPITNEVRYVGKSNNPKRRLTYHLDKKRGLGTHKRNWLNSLSSKPILEIIKEVSIDEWQKYEKFYIEYYLSIGCKLVNWGDGGEGLTYGNQTSFKKGHSGRKIVVITKDGELFKEFDSGKMLSEYFDKVGNGGFYQVLKKNRRFFVGYNYLYYDEYINMSEEDMKKHLDWLNNYADKREIGILTGFKKGSKTWSGAILNLRPSEGKEIEQYSLNNELIKIWKNAAVAGRELCIQRGNINNCANNKVETAGGFKWKYKNKII
jgi:predicted GIY-YIG superfamily endonuclease